MEFLALLTGIVGLWLGTEATIKGAVAARENLQTGQASDIVIGSAFGSALGQIGFVLGVTGLTTYLTLPKRIIYQHGGVLLGSLILLGLFSLDGHVTRT